MGRIIFMNATYHHPAPHVVDNIREDTLGLLRGKHYRIAMRQHYFGHKIDVRLVHPFHHRPLIGAQMAYRDMATFLIDWEPKQLVTYSDQEKDDRETPNFMKNKNRRK